MINLREPTNAYYRCFVAPFAIHTMAWPQNTHITYLTSFGLCVTMRVYQSGAVRRAYVRMRMSNFDRMLPVDPSAHAFFPLGVGSFLVVRSYIRLLVRLQARLVARGNGLEWSQHWATATTSGH